VRVAIFLNRPIQLKVTERAQLALGGIQDWPDSRGFSISLVSRIFLETSSKILNTKTDRVKIKLRYRHFHALFALI